MLRPTPLYHRLLVFSVMATGERSFHAIVLSQCVVQLISVASINDMLFSTFVNLIFGAVGKSSE